MSYALNKITNNLQVTLKAHFKKQYYEFYTTTIRQSAWSDRRYTGQINWLQEALIGKDVELTYVYIWSVLFSQKN